MTRPWSALEPLRPKRIFRPADCHVTAQTLGLHHHARWAKPKGPTRYKQHYALDYGQSIAQSVSADTRDMNDSENEDEYEDRDETNFNCNGNPH